MKKKYNNENIINYIGFTFSLILILLGIFLTPILLIYGIPMFFIFLFIFLNKKEDTIEQIKKR